MTRARGTPPPLSDRRASALGAVFLYYGLKAVQLTGMSTRVWKRAAEYSLILAERRRLLPVRGESSASRREE